MQIIPTSITDSNYSQTVSLSGRDYDIILMWNQRDGRWYLSMDTDGERILSNVRVVADWVLVYPGQAAPLPPNMLFTVDVTGAGTDPGLSELGDRVYLCYDNGD